MRLTSIAVYGRRGTTPFPVRRAQSSTVGLGRPAACDGGVAWSLSVLVSPFSLSSALFSLLKKLFPARDSSPLLCKFSLGPLVNRVELRARDHFRPHPDLSISYLRLPTYRAGQATKFPDFIVALSSIQNAANALAPDIHLLILVISFPNHRSIRVSDESIA